MAQIIKSLSLDVSRKNRRRAIFAKQFDNDSRFLNVQLNNEGEPIEVAKTSVVLINATRADGGSESFMGGVNDDGSVTVPIAYWMLEVPGKVMCDVSVISEQGSKLSSLNFAIEVEKTNGDGDDIAETEDCGILVQLIADVKRLEDDFQSVFVRYSANADGTDYSDVWSDGMQYIGIANTDTEPSDKSGYIWCRFAVPEQENSVTVDAELSLESENPIQNKAVKAALDSTNINVSSIFQRQEQLGNRLNDLQNQVDSMGEHEESAPEYSGATSWNDLTDKPFGENADGTVKQLDNKYLSILDCQDGDFRELMPSTVSTTKYNNMFQVYGLERQISEELHNYWHSSEGGASDKGNVFVEFDGVTYECAPQRIAVLNNAMAVGNCTAWGGTDNGEPFAAIAMNFTSASGGDTEYYLSVAALTDTASTQHTVRVYQGTTLGKWLLKEQCLPILDLKPVGLSEIIPEITQDGFMQLNSGNYAHSFDGYRNFLIEGESYKFSFDGVEYTNVAKKAILQGTNGQMLEIVYIGNIGLVSGAVTSEPFILYEMTGEVSAILTNLPGTSHVIRLRKVTDGWVLKAEYLLNAPQPVSIDLSGLDENGTIVETYADGTSKTTTIEFAANGNPIKITDGAGNVTTLTW